MVDKKKFESYVGYTLIIFPILLFIVIPAHPSSYFDYTLNDFIDKYLLGNGYYSPPNYPFTSKVVNSFSVAIAIVLGIFIGFWRKDDVEENLKYMKYSWIWILLILGLGISAFSLSINPQEFKESKLRRSFGTSESFHNNPITFLFMIIVKQICLYIGIRAPLTYLLYSLDKIRK